MNASSSSSSSSWRCAPVLAAALALAACRAASADRPPEASRAEPAPTAAGSAAPAPVPAGGALPVPPGWVPLERAATAGQDAAGKGASVDVRAWGDPAAGCYAALVTSAGAARASLAAALGGLEQVLSLELGAPALPTPAAGPYDATVAIAAGALAGQVRVRGVVASDGTPRLVALACVGNEREPARCQAACGPILAAAPEPR